MPPSSSSACAAKRRHPVEVGEVDGPRPRVGRVGLQPTDHLVEPVGPATADADDRAPLREALGQRRADPGRTPGDEHLAAGDVVAHRHPPST